MTSPEKLTPQSPKELCEFLNANAEGDKKTLSLKECDDSVFIKLSEMNQLVDFASDDMTITVQTGMTFSKLQEIVSKENLHLPIDVPFPDQTTIGDLYLENLNGCHLYGRGTLRDYTIGMTALDSRGKLFHSGGRVVKNVAGYDLCKLLLGSRGTLAIVTELTFKLIPLPESKKVATIHFKCHEEVEDCLSYLNTSSLRPIICDLLNKKSVIKMNHQLQEISSARIPEEYPFVLILGFEGFDKEVDWSVETVKNESDSSSYSTIEYYDHSASGEIINVLSRFSEFNSGNISIRINTIPSFSAELSDILDKAGFAIQTHAGNGIIKGSQLCPDNQCEYLVHQMKEISDQVAENRGHLVFAKCPKDWRSQFTTENREDPAKVMMKKIRETFDPDQLLSKDELIPVY